MDYKQMEKFWTDKYKENEGKEYWVVGAHGKSYEQYLHNSKDIMNEFKTVLQEAGTVIDFGCGIGRFRPMLQQYFENYIGVDLVKKIDTDEEYQTKYGRKKLRFYQTKEFMSMSLKADAVFCSVVLQHIAENSYLSKVIEKFKNALPIGGKVYINEQIGDTWELIRKGQRYIHRRPLKEYDKLFNGFKRIHDIKRKEDSHRLVVYERI